MSAISPKTLILFVIVLLLVGCTVFMLQGMLPSIGLRNEPLGSDLDVGARVKSDHLIKMSSKLDMRKANLLEELLPQSLDLAAKNIKVIEKHLRVMNRDVFYREAVPPENMAPSHQNAVLLHGMSFNSQTWLELGTINLLAAMGHRVVAFDLPGYGETGGEQLVSEVKADFLESAMKALHLDKPVIVSPSMSGSYSLPFLFKFTDKMGGYVTVAPVATGEYTEKQYETVKTPTLIIYGENDIQLGKVSTLCLKNIPNSQVQMLENAKHPAYLDQPAIFHKLLYNFFLKLKN